MLNKRILVLFLLVLCLLPFFAFSKEVFFSIGGEISSQDSITVKVSASLVNFGEMQPNVKFGLELLKKDNNSRYLVDTFVSSEEFLIDANQLVVREINYTLPVGLDGNYSLMLVAKNNSGLVLAFVNVGDLNFNNSSSSISFVKDSCYLKVGDEEEIYAVNFGVDVSKSEKLFAFCTVKNNFSEQKIIVPKIETFFRTVYGKKLSSADLPSFTLASGEQKEISFEIPKASEAQAYDAKMTLISNGAIVSTPIIFHYVLQGNSATLQRVQIDKNYYSAGDDAVVSIVWTGPAQNFVGSRSQVEIPQMFAEVSMKNESGVDCFPKIVKELPKEMGGVLEIKQKVVLDCKSPAVMAVIKDSFGKSLNEINFSINQSQAGKDYESMLFNLTIILFGLIISAIIILGLFMILKKKVFK
jgi:hypothetical protein